MAALNAEVSSAGLTAGLAELSKVNAELEPMDANEQSQYWDKQPVPGNLAMVSFNADFAERLEHAEALLQETITEAR
jgi:hypothetical protein